MDRLKGMNPTSITITTLTLGTVGIAFSYAIRNYLRMGIISSKQQQSTLLGPSMEGNADEVKRLIGIYIADNGKSSLSAYINATNPAGNAAIHGAVFAGHVEILSFLIESCDGADMKLTNGLGCSPLWIAAGYNRLDCLEYLIDKLHDSNELESALLEDGKNNSGDTPFLAAASKGNMEACEQLLRAVEKCSQNNQNNSDICLQMKAKILRTANDAGDTPLKVAVASSQGEEILTFLLNIDNEISPGQFGKSPIPSEDEDLILHTCVNRKNKLGLSPLIIACERNLATVAELLLQHGADICIQDPKGRNILAIAAFCGCNDTLEFLLNQTSKKTLLLNQQDLIGCTPVWLAARTGNLSIVEMLMDAGADASIKDNEGLLPQDVAIKFKKEKVMEYFSHHTQ